MPNTGHTKELCNPDCLACALCEHEKCCCIGHELATVKETETQEPKTGDVR